MRWKQQLRKDAAGTLRAQAPGVPSAATVSVYSPLGAALLTGVAATLDGPSTTIASWSSTAPKFAVLTSATGIVIGNEYWLVAANGRKQSCRVVGVVSATKTIEFQDEPEFDLAAGTGFYSFGASYSVASTVLAEYGQGFRIEWTWTIGGLPVVTEEIFDVVHSPAHNPATGAGFRRAHPWAAEKWDQANEGHDWDDLVAHAFLMVCYDLESYVTDAKHDMPHAIVDWSQFEPAVYLRLLADHATTMIPADLVNYPQDYMAHSYAKYKTAMDGACRNLRYADTSQNRTGETMRRRGGELTI